MKRILFIVNPKSGDRKKGHLQDLVNQFLPSSQFETRLDFTTHAGHAKELAKRGIDEAWDYVVAAGGDGTINEVASQLIGKTPALGIIPYGSGNGFARHLQIPLLDKQAVQALANCQVVPIDVGYVNQHPFFCTSGVGFDSLIGKKFEELPHRGLKGYLKTVWREIRKFEGLQMHIEGEEAQRAFLFTAANAGQFGNNAWIAPLADISDGKLDFCMVKPFPLRLLPMLGYRLIRKSLRNSAYYSSFSHSSCKLTLSEEFPYHADGEIIGIAQELHWTIESKALRVVVPLR
ncbi:MAG: diacylglycerol kinase family lipid kinase [Cytophagaceae bacterium]|jgi:YegS/Rv2252/BmrU family lipid kinase|nr:diacylglycerol kinase family lipid kinase [Cytophagaceae bacterium]